VRYAERKRLHLDTAEQCNAAGLRFFPFVVEAEGGLGAEARALLGVLAADAARVTGESRSQRAEMATQSISVLLQRANALAVARRAVGVAVPLAAPLAAARDELVFAAALPTIPTRQRRVLPRLSPLPLLRLTPPFLRRPP
jgi:hypothetical protein